MDKTRPGGVLLVGPPIFLGNLRGLSRLNSMAGITGGKSWKP